MMLERSKVAALCAGMSVIVVVLGAGAGKDLNCIGEVLEPGQTLYPNDFIGPDWACNMGGYRFGLDEDGFLGAWEYDGIVTWHSGIRGDHLRMQRDGNLVLRAGDGTALWASSCYGEGVELRNDGSMPIIKAVDRDGNLVWQIYGDGQESVCYPNDDDGDAYPEIKCRGTILGTRVRLYANEYICDRTGQNVRFGLNARGKLALWHGKRAVWTPPHQDDFGDFIDMQDDGNLVLYNYLPGPNEPRWRTGCFSENAILKLENGGVKVEKRNGGILWMIDSQGNKSAGCNPPTGITTSEDCSSVSLFGNECVIQMIDFHNMNIVIIQVKDLADGRFTVTDNFDSESCWGDGAPWEVSVEVRNNGSLDIDAGVPDVNCDEILTSPQYQMKDDVQLTFRPNSDRICNLFGRNLIYFMVLQWFYLG